MNVEWRWQEKSLPFPVYVPVSGDESRVPAVVTTRKGGFGRGPFESLNLSTKVNDDSQVVERNRTLLARTLGLDEQQRASPSQVHGSIVLRALSPGNYSEADGLVTDSSKIWLSVNVADCVPVIVFDAELTAVGLAHAGRNGTVLGITANLINVFKSTFGIAPSDLFVALGPSIGPCCYELDRRTASELPCGCLVERDGRMFFDLWKANTLQAVGSGVAERNILQPPACTSCKSELFFSHRAHRGVTGRQAAIAKAGGLVLRPL